MAARLPYNQPALVIHARKYMDSLQNVLRQELTQQNALGVDRTTPGHYVAVVHHIKQPLIIH